MHKYLQVNTGLTSVSLCRFFCVDKFISIVSRTLKWYDTDQSSEKNKLPAKIHFYGIK